MKNRTICLILWMFVFSVNAIGQDTYEELWYANDTATTAISKTKILNKLAYKYRFNKPDSSVYYANLAAELAAANDFTLEHIVALNTKGTSLAVQRKIPDAQKLFRQVIELANVHDQPFQDYQRLYKFRCML